MRNVHHRLMYITSGPWLKALFGEIMAPLGGRALQEEILPWDLDHL